jgi:hypothetical protein
MQPNTNGFIFLILCNLRFAASDVAQTKERRFCNQHPTNQFLPSINEVLDYLHKHVNVFLNNFANAIWSLKGLESLHLSILVIFLSQKTSSTLQRMQASSIYSHVIAIKLVIS